MYTPPPPLTRVQVRRVDEIAIRDYGLTGLVLMENAGRGCVDELVRRGVHGPVVIACGKGNNAGDGFVIARQLRVRHIDCRMLLFAPAAELAGDAAANYAICERLHIPTVDLSQVATADEITPHLRGAEWLVDALLGTGTQGPPRPPFNLAIEALNAAAGRKLAVDLPSGLDCDTGSPTIPTFRAEVTCTFVAAKTGFAAPSAAEFLGDVVVCDIGLPAEVVARAVGP